MTIIDNETITCGLCSKKSDHTVAMSTNAFGSPDLDTRPPEMKRSTMFTWVQRCPHCGYCSSDITAAFEKSQTLISSAEYQFQLQDRRFPEMANSFLCQAIIAEKNNRFSEAAWATIHAVWACDDLNYDQVSQECRIKAVALIQKSIEAGENFAKQEGADIAIMADLLRRARKFKEASDLITSYQDKIAEDIIKKILEFQQKLILQNNTKNYTISQVLENE